MRYYLLSSFIFRCHCNSTEARQDKPRETTLLAKYFGRISFGHFLPHFGQTSDKNVGH